MNGYFSIGEMARLFDINPRTLRYYDSIGLLRPAKINEYNGYRYYGSAQIERLNTILYLRQLNISIEKICAVFDNKDVNTLVNTLLEQKKMIAEQIAQLVTINKKLNRRLEGIRNATESLLYTIEPCHLAARPISLLKRVIGVESDFEKTIRELELSSGRRSSVFLGKIGFTLSVEEMGRGEFSNFSSIFLLLEEDECDQAAVAVLPESDYLIYRFAGTHAESSQYYEIMLDYLRAHGLKQQGDAVEITLIDYGITNDRSQFVTALQIPYVNL